MSTVQLEATTEKVRAENRALHELVAMASHDLRTPLAVIVGALELLSEPSSQMSPSEAAGLVDAARAQAAVAERLVDDLLTAGALGAPGFIFKIEPVELVTTVAKVVEGLRSKAEQPLIVRVEANHRAIRVLADEVRQVQILTNLMTDAMKYGARDQHIEIRISTVASMAQVAVSNGGAPIPAADRDRISQPFFRRSDERRSGGSMGLGLYIARRLAEGQGGTMSVSSSPTRTTFSHTVPLAE